ncbi:MAG: hypothetical protein AAGF24_02710 [Cyanobacteria bacterium P01_H01_bin.121]
MQPFQTANYLLRKAQLARWQRQQAREQILRCQVGFATTKPDRPLACVNCRYYHGVPYGQHRDRRVVLICGFHPCGWQQTLPCPDWQPLSESDLD